MPKKSEQKTKAKTKKPLTKTNNKKIEKNIIGIPVPIRTLVENMSLIDINEIKNNQNLIISQQNYIISMLENITKLSK